MKKLMREETISETAERLKLQYAVKIFAEAIFDRLLEKCREGYRGWDGGYPYRALVNQILMDANNLNEKSISNVELDIAARAMMLWYRKHERVPVPAKAKEGK